jgi:hypothetical protein
VVYWVSLGAQPAATPERRTRLRRIQTAAGIRARTCLEGRVDAGTYRVTGLNLVDREGNTVANRVDASDLPEQVSACIVAAFKEISLTQEPDTFVRPVVPVVEFEVHRDGSVRIRDEDWLALIEREEKAKRAARRAELLGRDRSASSTDEAGPSPGADAEAPSAAMGEPEEEGAPGDPDAAGDRSAPPGRRRPPGDPAKGGTKLDLRTRPR